MADADAVLDLQRSAGNAAVVQLLGEEGQPEEPRSPVLDVVGRGGGQPLDKATMTTMEAGLGADFSDVRVHTDGAASSSAQAVQAHAYTVGNDVVFQSGQYQPDTSGGQRMLAHELTHVAQQRSGPVEGTATGGGISVSDPSDPFERAAEANADRFASMPNSADTAHAAAPASPGVQRANEEDPVIQGIFLQREGIGEDEEEVQGSFVQRQREGEETEEEGVTG
jgi:hypothetical protein